METDIQSGAVLAREAVTRFIGKPKKTPVMDSPAALAAFLKSIHPAGCAVERFYAVILDVRNRVIAWNLVSQGVVNCSLVHPREVFREAIRLSGCALIVAHNHPSGDVNPSGEDDTVTRRLVEAGKTLGMSVLDHIIIADGPDYYSYREVGALH